MKALVTGASSGIGRDMAIELSHRGYDLILVARSEEKLKEVKEKIKTNVEIVILDLTVEENCKKLYSMYPEVDILINNAGFGTFGRFEDIDIDKDTNLIKTNIIAVNILTKLYLKEMKQKNKGHILNVASIAGFMPGPLMDAYYASKAYVVRLSEGIREELKKDKSNVKISILCPGPVDTNFNATAQVEFNAKSLTSNYVATYAINKMLKNKFYIVPGLSIKMVRFFAKIIPNNIMTKFVYKVQERKK